MHGFGFCLRVPRPSRVRNRQLSNYRVLKGRNTKIFKPRLRHRGIRISLKVTISPSLEMRQAKSRKWLWTEDKLPRIICRRHLTRLLVQELLAIDQRIQGRKEIWEPPLTKYRLPLLLIWKNRPSTLQIKRNLSSQILNWRNRPSQLRIWRNRTPQLQIWRNRPYLFQIWKNQPFRRQLNKLVDWKFQQKLRINLQSRNRTLIQKRMNMKFVSRDLTKWSARGRLNLARGLKRSQFGFQLPSLMRKKIKIWRDQYDATHKLSNRKS